MIILYFNEYLNCKYYYNLNETFSILIEFKM